MLATLRSTIVEHAGTFDPASYDGVDARLALDDLTVMVRVAESMRNRMMKQIADTNAWAGTGALDAARYCARVTGLGSGEARDTIRVGGEGVRQDLDRDVATERGIPRAIHLAHPAGAESGHDLVGAEARAWSERHCSRIRGF